jgi:hypothetical protein
VLALPLILAIGSNGLNWDGPEIYTLTGRGGNHRFTVTFRQANFASHGRHVYWRYSPGSYEGSWPHTRFYMPAWRVKGASREFRGYDTVSADVAREPAPKHLAKHDTELASLTVTVDGKAWKVPRRAYEGCLDPDLGSEYESAVLSTDGNTLRVSMDGSDGAGGYTMHWTIRRNGRTTVHVDGPL